MVIFHRQIGVKIKNIVSCAIFGQQNLKELFPSSSHPNAWGLSLFRFSKTCNKTTGFPLGFRSSLLETEGLKIPETLPKKRPFSWPFVVETRRSRRNHVHPGGNNRPRPMGGFRRSEVLECPKKRWMPLFLGSPLSAFVSPGWVFWSTITALSSSKRSFTIF